MKVRCAIYTRKSSEDGLEQAFNSLHAQRESCAAYILSQASEGWSLIPDEYDDGGISGGSLARPALQRMLADISAGKIDIVVVYKVDRLTRSLLDFSTLVQTFDAAGTSFVSVTQSFNTTTSMGRLTLNMLLSFAQFEREVTAERIRDKIAASKAKGMWMGGTPPIGYKPAGRTLEVVEPHAVIIRHIFERYLALGTVKELTLDLEAEGIFVPTRITGTGRASGGGRFFRGQLYAILTNAVYIGLIPHRKQLYPGQHAAIIDQVTWDKVQARLAAHLMGPRPTRNAKNPSLLAGLIVDEAGEPLVATHACKGTRRYRYYVSRDLHHQGRETAAAGIRIPAREVESAVIERLVAALGDPLRLLCSATSAIQSADFLKLQHRAASLAEAVRKADAQVVQELVTRVQVHPDLVTLTLSTEALATLLETDLPDGTNASISLNIPLRLTRTGKVVRLIQSDGRSSAPAAVEESLVKLIVRARGWWERMRTGEIHVAALAREEGVSASYIGKFVVLAFLSPSIIESILSADQPAHITALSLTAGRLPLSWKVQESLFG